MALKRPAVSQSVVIPWAWISAPISASEGASGGATTRRPPLRSGPQISSVAASKAIGASWRKTSSSAKRA